jgi:hypothetical protein
MGSEPTPAAAAPRGFAQDVVDLYVAPDDAFKSLISKRVWWLGVLLFMALNLAFTGYWQQKVDARGFMEAQIEESGRADQIPPERREAVVDQQLKFFNVFVWLGPLVFTPLFVFASAAVYLFIFRFFYAGELDYLTAVCVCSFAYLAVGLIQSPLILLTIVLKGDWTINPQEALLAGPAAFFDKGELAKPIFGLLASIDLFSFWTLFLLAVGFGVAAKRATGSALWGAATPWLVYVIVKVGWAAFTG